MSKNTELSTQTYAVWLQKPRDEIVATVSQQLLPSTNFWKEYKE